MATLPEFMNELSTSYTSNSGRIARHELLYKLWRNNAYSGTGVADLIDTLDLYKFIRGLYNPAYRLAAFYGQYVYSGVPDLEAGNGLDKPSSLPIITDDQRIRKYISGLLKNTDLLRALPIIPEWGSRDGDVFVSVNLDMGGNVSFSVLRPTELKELELDDAGNIMRYVLERQYYGSNRMLTTYRETATIKNGIVGYTIEDGYTTEYYSLNIGFIPIVHIPHNYTGTRLGSAEIVPSLLAAIEVDDSASTLFDQIRKVVNPAWLMSGVRKPTQGVNAGNTAASQRDVVDRQSVKMYYSNDTGSRAWPLVADLQIGAALESIKQMLDYISLNHPELKVASGLDNSSGDISGRAFITSRTSAAQNIVNARANYDDGIRKMISMAWFLQEGIKTPPPVQLDFNIGDRPVFPLTASESAELEKAWLINAGLADRVHIPVGVYMEMVGKSPELIKLVASNPVYTTYIEQVTNSLGDGFGGFSLENRAGEESFRLPSGDVNGSEPNLPFGDFDGNSN